MILMLQYTAIFSDLLVSKGRCRGDGESLAWHVLPHSGYSAWTVVGQEEAERLDSSIVTRLGRARALDRTHRPCRWSAGELQ